MSNNYIESIFTELQNASSIDTKGAFEGFCKKLYKKIHDKHNRKLTKFDISDYLETSILYQSVIAAGLKSGYLQAQDHKKTADKDGKQKDLILTILNKEKFPTNDQIKEEMLKVAGKFKKNLSQYKELNNNSIDELVLTAIEDTILNVENNYMQQTRAVPRINKIQSYLDNEKNTQIIMNQHAVAEMLFGSLIEIIGTACSFLLPDEWNKSESEKALSGTGSSTGIFASTSYESGLAEQEKQLERLEADESFKDAVHGLSRVLGSSESLSDSTNVDSAAKRQNTLNQGFTKAELPRSDSQNSN